MSELKTAAKGEVIHDPFVAEIASRHGEDLMRFLSRRARNAADARDLAQEVYVRLLRLDRKDLIRDPQAYVYRVAANLLYEFSLRRQADAAGMHQWSEEIAADEPMAPGADRSADIMYMGARLRKVLEELRPKCRTVIVLHRLEGMTYDEIGSELNISASMVKKYLRQGLTHCRKRLESLR